MVLFRSRNTVRNEDVIPDISAPRLLRMTAIRNSMRVEQRFIGDKHGSMCGMEEGKYLSMKTIMIIDHNLYNVFKTIWLLELTLFVRITKSQPRTAHRPYDQPVLASVHNKIVGVFFLVKNWMPFRLKVK